MEGKSSIKGHLRMAGTEPHEVLVYRCNAVNSIVLYLRLLQMRDCWDRSIIEHAIVSGRHAIFDAVFEIIRQDVYDEEIEQMMEVGEDSEYEQTPIRVALNSEGGKKMEDLVSGKIRHLKKDVVFRVESSTVTSKIQSFIPGNLIVIFHVLLPEIRENSLAPLILLVLLCCIAPFWAWGASLVLKTYPERQNTLARVTWARHLLACPSMFFWGVGTSTIGQHSFGWNESMCAAALAVATVLIPAIDSFAAGTGARAFYGTIFVKVLGLYDDVNEQLQSRFNTQWRDLDVIQPEVASSDNTPTGRASISSERSPRLHWPAQTMENGSE